MRAAPGPLSAKRLAAAAALLVVPAAVGAQDPGAVPAAEAPAASPHPYRLRTVAPHGHGTGVAVALRLHAGSQDDPEGSEGTAWLLGRVLESQANRALDPSSARVEVMVERATTVVTLLALPPAWEAAWAAVDSIVFDAPLEGAAVERERAHLVEVLAFEAGSPFRDFEAEAAALLTEPGSPFARPVRGTRVSLARVGPLELERFRGLHLRREAAAQAVVGPVAGATAAAPEAAPTAPERAVAWLTGQRIPRVQDVTNTWIQVAYPAPGDLPRTHLELVAHLLREELDPTPPPPDRYGLDVRLEETPRGPVLVVEASVFPEAAGAWESRILGTVSLLADEPMGEDFFRWRRRRFRAARLLDESAPEVEARRLTADLLRDGTARDLAAEIWALEARTLRDSARALGPPRILFFGPDLGESGPPTPGTGAKPAPGA